MFSEEKKTLESIDKRIAGLSTEKKPKKEKVISGNLSIGIQIMSDLIAGVIVGLGIGLFLDGVFDTKPLLMIIFLFIGSAAGFLNVYRTVDGYTKKQEQEDKLKD